MSQDDLAKLELTELESKLKAAQTVQRTVIGIFAVIVLAWIVLGYWQTNLPVFIITIVLGIVTVLPTSANLKKLQAEIAKRRDA